MPGCSTSLLRVLKDNRVDGRQFFYCREFTEDDFLREYRQAEQEVFGRLDTSLMIDFLMLRLRGALQESWMDGARTLQRCVLSGRVTFADLRQVVADLVASWTIVREFVRYTAPGHSRCEVDKVRCPLPKIRSCVRLWLCHGIGLGEAT